MTTLLSLLAALVIGAGGAVQSAMLGALGRERTPIGAAWVSVWATVGSLALLLLFRSLRDGEAPAPPFRRPELLGALALGCSLLLLSSMRGLPWHYAVTGMFGLAFIVGAGVLVPRIGVAFWVGGTLTGTLMTGVLLDHLGAFGATATPASPSRLVGIGLLLAGLGMIRR